MDEWAKFLAHSLGKRLEADKFEKYAQLLSGKHPLPPRRIADILLRPTKHNAESLDPQIPQYIQRLLYADLLDLPSILRALLKYSTFRPNRDLKIQDDNHKHVLRWANIGVQAETLIYALAKSVSNGSRPKNAQEAVEVISVLTEWAKALAAASDADDIMHETQATEALNMRVALGTLLVAASDSRKILSVLGTSFPKGIPVLSWNDGPILFP
jgi:mediator of RNA polymerase II transcription subunit 5